MLFEVAKGKAGFTDRNADATHAVIPSLLAVSAVHHHLISVGNACRQRWLWKVVKYVK